MNMECIVNREYIEAGSKAVLHLAVDISPPPAAQAAEAVKPLNVCLTIDRSGSMHEERKIENAKLAAFQLIQSLKPRDYVSLITFAGSERVDINARPASDLQYFRQAINSIKAQGYTDIYSALKTSFEETAYVSRGIWGPHARGGIERPVTRIILLTDGQPTKGKDKVEDFVDLCIDMRRNDISVTALGLGSDYNEELLSAIASHSGGAWYHITDPTNLPGIFAEELLEMKTVLVVKPELHLQLLSGAELSDIHKVRPMLDIVKDPEIIDSKYIIPLSDIVGGQPQNFVARVHVPARPEGRYRIARVELLSGDTRISKEIVLKYTNDASLYGKETNQYPRMLLLMSQGTRLIRDGVSSEDETIVNQAETLVKSAWTDSDALTVLKGERRELLVDLKTRFERAHEKTIVKKGKLTKEEKKRLLSETTIIKKGK